MFVTGDRIVAGKSTLLVLTPLKREDLSMECQQGRAGQCALDQGLYRSRFRSSLHPLLVRMKGSFVCQALGSRVGTELTINSEAVMSEMCSHGRTHTV